MEYILIIIAAVFINNIVLSQFLGVCSFIGVSNKMSTAIGMTGAVVFVMVLSTLVTYLIYQNILVPFELGFLRTIAFILVIAALVQMVEIIIKKISPSLYQALGIFLPLITTNCAVLGIAVLTVQKDLSLVHGLVFTFANSLGYGFAIILFSSIREHIELMNIPTGMKGVPIAFILTGLLAMAFMGFSGMV